MTENITDELLELKEFISGSLTQVLLGVAEAREHKDVGKGVAPKISKAKIDPDFKVAWHAGSLWTTVQFDIAVTASKQTSGEGKVSSSFKVLGVGFGADAGAKKTTSNETINRLHFSLPLQLNEPTSDT